MKTHRRWLWIGGALAAATAALVVGVPFATLLLVAAVLVCPVTMYFGMRGMHHGGGMACHPSVTDQQSPGDLPADAKTSRSSLPKASVQS